MTCSLRTLKSSWTFLDYFIGKALNSRNLFLLMSLDRTKYDSWPIKPIASLLMVLTVCWQDLSQTHISTIFNLITGCFHSGYFWLFHYDKSTKTAFFLSLSYTQSPLKPTYLPFHRTPHLKTFPVLCNTMYQY